MSRMVRVIPTGEIWTPAELAERWQVSVDTVVEMCRDGRIRGAFKAGREWRLSSVALAAHEDPLNLRGAA